MAICSWRNSCRWVTVFKHDVVHSQYYSLPSRITCRPWRKEVSPPWSIRPLRKQALSQRRLFSDFKGIFWSVSSLLYWTHLSEYSSYDFNSLNLSFSQDNTLWHPSSSVCEAHWPWKFQVQCQRRVHSCSSHSTLSGDISGLSWTLDSSLWSAWVLEFRIYE